MRLCESKVGMFFCQFCQQLFRTTFVKLKLATGKAINMRDEKKSRKVLTRIYGEQRSRICVRERG